VALEAETEKAITTGPATLDNVRAVLVSVDGETEIPTTGTISPTATTGTCSR
jgi:hypothetical protein